MSDNSAKNKNATLRRYAKKTKLVRLFGGKCLRCECSKINILNFHHIDPATKKFAVNMERDIKFSKLEEEANKCIILCHNCHREEHYDNRESIGKNRKIKLLNYVNKFCCEECGYSKCINALEFHHINPSEKESILPRMSFGLKKDLPEKVKTELGKCKVLCANCHNDLKFDHQLYENNREYVSNASENLHESHSYDKEVIYDLYVNQKMKGIEISKKLKVRYHWIKLLIREMGLGRAQKDINVSEVKMLELYEAGLTNIEIANQLKCCLSTVIKFLQKTDKQKNTQKYNKLVKIKISKDQMEELLKTNTYRDIGVMFGVDKQRVYKTCKRMGLKAIFAKISRGSKINATDI